MSIKMIISVFFVGISSAGFAKDLAGSPTKGSDTNSSSSMFHCIESKTTMSGSTKKSEEPELREVSVPCHNHEISHQPENLKNNSPYKPSLTDKKARI